MVTRCFKERMFPSEIYLVETFLHNNIESKDSSFAQSYRWSEWECERPWTQTKYFDREQLRVGLCLDLQWVLQKLVRCHEVSGKALTMCCRLKVRRLFSSLSREMLTFSRLIQHKMYLVFPVFLLLFEPQISSLWYIFCVNI